MEKNCFRGLIVVFLVICLSVSSIPCTSIDIKNDTVINDLNDKSFKLKETEIYFSAPHVKYNSIYAEISLSETDSSIMSPGKPVLPKINQIMKFPLGTKIKNIEIVLPEVKQLCLTKKIIRAPYPLLGNGKIGFIKDIFNKDSYKSSDEYPKEWFDYRTGGGIENNERVTFLSIQLYPVKYIQALNKIKYVEKLKINVEYELPDSPQTFPEVYDFLIIAPSEYNSNLNLLVEHKNNHSISTKLVNIEEINGQGRDKQEQIKYFIKESIENWGIKYVLLVGDKTKMPVRYTYPLSMPMYRSIINDVSSDQYYADIYDSEGKFSSWDSNNDDIFGQNTFFYSDEVDLYPDVALGRLYCADNTEVSDVVSKIISYEENKNQEWFDNIVICGGNTHPNCKDLRILIGIIRMLLGPGKFAYEGEYIGNKISDMLVNFNSEKFYASSILPGSPYKDRLTNENINNAINNGSGFVFFIGHGNPEAWGTFPPSFFESHDIMPAPEGYTIDQIDNLDNENKYPIMIFDACSCGDFSTTNSPIAWEAVKLKSKGAIASFASTDLAFGFAGTYCEKTCNNLIDLGIAKAIADGTEYVGDLLKSSINNYLNTAIIDNPYYKAFNIFGAYTIQIQELFGDPTLKIGGYR